MGNVLAIYKLKIKNKNERCRREVVGRFTVVFPSIVNIIQGGKQNSLAGRRMSGRRWNRMGGSWTPPISASAKPPVERTS